MHSWRKIQRQNFTSWEALASFLQWDEKTAAGTLQRSSFPLNIPRRLALKMAKNTLDDPLVRQFVPLGAEEQAVAGFSVDPVGDCAARKEGKLLHKYRGRALLLCTSACAMHCRYCFRRHFDYATGDKLFTPEIERIAQDTSIQEVLLSGGDPLSLSDTLLGDLLQNLSAIEHVRRIRIHTRFPIGIPERVDDPFLTKLRQVKKQLFFVIHANHPKELDEDVLFALGKLRCSGYPILHQAVLLKGVNDDVETLAALCEQLIDHGILPYYLHQLDRVIGAHHFEVDEKKGIMLIEQLRSRLPGYAVPHYVREEAGQPSKTLISLEPTA